MLKKWFQKIGGVVISCKVPDWWQFWMDGSYYIAVQIAAGAARVRSFCNRFNGENTWLPTPTPA
jgi:hypothetical protein